MTRFAFGKRGIYPSRNRCDGFGHCTFLGLKKETSQSQVTPTEGPGMRDVYFLYRQKIDVRYALVASQMITNLAIYICTGSRIFSKPFHLLGDKLTDHLDQCRVSIWAINYANHSHCDVKDNLTTEERIRLTNASKEIQDF